MMTRRSSPSAAKNRRAVVRGRRTKAPISKDERGWCRLGLGGAAGSSVAGVAESSLLFALAMTSQSCARGAFADRATTMTFGTRWRSSSSARDTEPCGRRGSNELQEGRPGVSPKREPTTRGLYGGTCEQQGGPIASVIPKLGDTRHRASMFQPPRGWYFIFVLPIRRRSQGIHQFGTRCFRSAEEPQFPAVVTT